MNDLAHRETADRMSSAALNLMLKTADIVGVDLQAALSRVGISPQPSGCRGALGALPSSAQLAAAFQALIAVLCAHSPQRDPRGSPSKEDVDLFCGCLINCENLGAAIDRAIRFTKISNDRWGELGLYTEGERSVFFMDSRRHGDTVAPAVLDMFGLSFFYKLFSWLIAEPLPLLEVALAHKRCSDELAIKDMFGCAVFFDRTATALIVDNSALKKPIMRTYRELLDVLAALPIALMPLPRTTSAKAQIEMIFRRALTAQMPVPGLEKVADLLNQSVSTLRRNLLREDTSFQAIIDRLRMHRSIELLGETELPIDDIAEILGFSARVCFREPLKVGPECRLLPTV